MHLACFPSGKRRGTIITALIALSLILSVMGSSAIHTAYAAPPHQPPTPGSAVSATVAVERAIVFPQPDRTADAITYLYERERVPVFGQSPDGKFLWVPVDNLFGWILTAQVDIEGDLATIPVIDPAVLTGTPALTPTITMTPFPVSPPAPIQTSTFEPQDKTATPTSAVTPAGVPTAIPTRTLSGTPAESSAMPLLPGVPPPVAITLPEGWDAAHLVVPFRTFDGQLHDAPLTVYFGPLSENVNGFIYLYWGFPNTVNHLTGEYNLWADGVQILRGSLIGDTCNLGVYEQQAFEVGGQEGVGADYQAANCKDESDTAGWFTVVRVQDGTFAFFVAVEPWDSLTDQRATLQASLDSVEFFPPEN